MIPTKFNVGGGSVAVPDHATLDRKLGDEAYPLTYRGERVPDGHCDSLYCSHVLEHFGHRDSQNALRDWVRALAPGGRLRIAVPDFDKLIEAVNKGNPDGWPIQLYIYGGQTDADDFHHAGYNEEWLKHLMEDAGLRDVRRFASDVQDCSSLPVSLNLEGTKPTSVLPAATVTIPKICAVMSMPRIAFTENMFSALEIAIARNVPFERHTGCWWEQGLTRLIEPHLEDGTEWILACDYDTKASVADFDALCRLMLEHPEADAIAPIQVKRDENNLLMGLLDDNGRPFPAGTKITTKHFDRDLIPVSWAHFGFTLFRVSAFRKMKKPWFHGQPDPRGGWGEGRIDPDIFFWRNFAESGNRAFLAGRIGVAHCQQLATYPTQDLTPQHAYIPDVHKSGKPDWVRH